jgi:hypothetical protein
MISLSLQTVACTLLGSIAIASACFRWVRSHVFGYGGAALLITGLILLSLSIRSTLEFRGAQTRPSQPDMTTLQRMIDDAHGKTFTAVAREQQAIRREDRG